MNDIFDTFLYLVTNLFLVIATIRFVKLFFHKSKCGLKGWVSFVAIFFTTSSYLFLKLGNPIISLMSSCIFTYLSSSLFEGEWQKKVLASISALTVTMLLDSAVYSLFGAIFKNGSESYIRNSITVILLFMVTNIFDRVFHYKIKQNIDIFSWLLILIVPIGSVIIAVTVYSLGCPLPENIIIVSILLLINVAIFYLYDEIIKYTINQHEKELLTVQNLAYINQFETIKESQNKVINLNHDIKNYVLSLQCLLENQDYSEISVRLKKIVDYTEAEKNWSKTNNLEIDSFINYKLSQIKSIGADIEYKINIPEIHSFDMFDLTIIWGNLLDNALEALTNADNKFFKFSIELERGIIYIHTSNTYSKKLDKRQGKFFTTKHDKLAHGLGLKNIETTIKKYNGTMEINVTEEFFQTNIMLYPKKL